MKRRHLLATAPLLGLGARASASQRAPVLVELFTSQGCSSCPPADRLLADLAARPDVLALAFHVTYWDRLGWADTFGSPRFTERQQAYAARLGGGLYTPEAVIGGELALVGSDPRIATAVDLLAERRMPALLEVTPSGSVELPSLGIEDGADLWAAAYDDHHAVAIESGENAGRQIIYSNVVRSYLELGRWNGRGRRVMLPADRWAGEGRNGLALVAQRPTDGRVLAIGRARLASTATL